MVIAAPEQTAAGGVIVTTPVGGITVIVKVEAGPVQITPLSV
jgi:L-serine deaminase